MPTPHSPALDEELPFKSAGDKHVRIGDDNFSMTIEEWNQVKTWIAARQQETAMRWWAAEFEIPFAKAVGIINRVQIAIEFGKLT